MDALHFAPGQNFDCSLCGKCCAGWQILVDSESRARIRGSLLELRVIQETGRAAFRRKGGEIETAHRTDGRCVFLNEQRLCGVQAELGAESKPKGCHRFPFQLTRTPEGVFVGISFYCSAAQRNEGRPMEAHTASVKDLLADEMMVGDEPMPVYRRVSMGWSAYRVLEDFLQVNLDFSTALAGLCGLLASAGKRRLELTPGDVRRALGRGYDIELQARLAEPSFHIAVSHLDVETLAEIPNFCKQLRAGEPVHFRRFRHAARLSEMEEAGRLEPWAEKELDRYLRALLYRKFLVGDRPLQSNVAILYLLPRLFRLCGGLSRLARGASEMEPVDVYRALDNCEYYFVTHASGLDRTYARLVSAVVGMFT